MIVGRMFGSAVGGRAGRGGGFRAVTRLFGDLGEVQRSRTDGLDTRDGFRRVATVEGASSNWTGSGEPAGGDSGRRRFLGDSERNGDEMVVEFDLLPVDVEIPRRAEDGAVPRSSMLAMSLRCLLLLSGTTDTRPSATKSTLCHKAVHIAEKQKCRAVLQHKRGGAILVEHPGIRILRHSHGGATLFQSIGPRWVGRHCLVTRWLDMRHGDIWKLVGCSTAWLLPCHKATASCRCVSILTSDRTAVKDAAVADNGMLSTATEEQ